MSQEDRIEPAERTQRPPGQFSAEYEAMTCRVGVVQCPATTQVEIAGSDAASFLNRLSTNKLDNLPAGTGRETFFTDAKAHILAYGYVFAVRHSLIFQSAGSQAANIINHLEKYRMSDDVRLRELTGQWAQPALVGPQSLELLAKISSRELPASRLQEHLAHFGADIAGTSVVARMICATLPIAVLLDCPAGSEEFVARALADGGARLCRADAAEAVRIEANRPEFGRDITTDNFPQEVGRDELTISFTKGCYLGQETIARIDSRGHVNKLLCGVRFPAARVPADGTELLIEGRSVGEVTSSAYSPSFRSAVAFAYVRREYASPGTRLDSPAGQADVIPLPTRGT